MGIPAQNAHFNRSRPICLTCISPPPRTEKDLAFVELEPSRPQSHIVAKLHTAGEKGLTLLEEDNGRSDITANLPSTVTSEELDAQSEEDLLSLIANNDRLHAFV